MRHGSVAFTLSKYASFVPNYGDMAVGLDEALGGHPHTVSNVPPSMGNRPAGVAKHELGKTNVAGPGASIAERPELSPHKLSRVGCTHLRGVLSCYPCEDHAGPFASWR